MQEKTKLLVHRLIWLVIVLLIIFVPAIVAASQPELEIVDHNCYINNYYSYLDETSVNVDITFNRKVGSGYATISYYDSSNHYLGSERSYFYGYSTTVESSYICIDGKVDSYKILSYEFEPDNSEYYLWRINLIIAIPMFIGALLLSYKRYDYNGKTISVYAGWFHHTLRINDEKCDEHNTLFSWTPIYLSTTLDDGTNISATITLTNRISVKVNDRLLTH